MNNNTATTIDRTLAPGIKDAILFDLHLKPYEKIVLKNGVEVYAVNAGAEEVLHIEWVFFAGNSYEDQDLVAASANYMLKNGTSAKNAFTINEHFDYYGASLNRSCYNETATLSLHCLSKHVDKLLPVVKEILTDSIMPEEELDIYKQNMKQRLQVNLRKSEFIAGRMMDVYLYGEQHPYGKYTRAEDFDKLERQQLLAFYNTYYRQGKMILFVAGKLPVNLEQLLNDNFGDLENNTIAAKTTIVQASAEKKFRITNEEGGVQGSIRIARPFPNRHDPDFPRVQVLNTLLGGFFGSRLMSNIREDKGYTYGIHSYLQNHIQQTAWMISTEAGKDVCEAAITEVYKEMALLREVPVDEEELLLVKNYMIGGVLGDLDGPFHIIARWKNLILNDLDGSYFDRSVNIIKSITAEEVQELANKYLQPESFYELVVF